MEIVYQKTGDVCYIEIPDKAYCNRVGDVCEAYFDGINFEQVGNIKKFTQKKKSRSIRTAKVLIKYMVQVAFSEDDNASHSAPATAISSQS